MKDTSSETEKYPPLPTTIVETLRKELSWPKLFFLGIMVFSATIAIVVVTNTPPIGDCVTSNNESFLNGTEFGLEYAVYTITQEAIRCNTIPVNYKNYSYTLIAVECLDLNNTQGGK